MTPQALKASIQHWSAELGFSACGIAPPTVPTPDEAHLVRWLQRGYQGQMAYMGRHGRKRARPQQLVPGTRSIIAVRLDYWPGQAHDSRGTREDPEQAFISRYSLGRDYHKLMRKRLQRLAEHIRAATGPFAHRAFVDSGPLLERALARQAGLGWIGKNTMLLSRRAGSYFFLGELLTDLTLPADGPSRAHCGSCRRCLRACPSGALVAPYQLDARRCISYLTMEHDGPIPEALRPHMGNRIFGCDDCQLACPWNRFAPATTEADFQPRHGLDAARLTALLEWDEATFLTRTAGSAIRRIGHERWLRNIAVALGNSTPRREALQALERRRAHPSPVVREHVEWALARLAGP